MSKLSILSFALAAIFLIFGCYVKGHKEPILFWSATRNKNKKVQDVKGYNRANVRMWMLYALCFVITGIPGLFGLWLVNLILLAFIAVPGFLFLMYVYTKLEERYLVSG
ncbi:hypothetical protein [Anaerolentibacter hominis]|uniref:hypothetical protein n=1 Tax=Anaerolentibacter hominis TaxID=3079009 RepID=UPI0031B82BE5